MPRRSISLFDDFARADGAPGSAPSGHAWMVTGGNLPVIVDGRLVNAAGAAGYVFRDLGLTPIRMRASFSFSPTGTPGTQVVVLLNNRLGEGVLVDLVHLYLSHAVWNLQLGTPGSFVTPLGERAFAQPLAVGTVYTVDIEVSGNTATILLPDGTVQLITHALIGQYWGRYCGFETQWASGQTQPRFESVAVDVERAVVASRTPVASRAVVATRAVVA